jgi:hypothetical protein
MQAAGDAQNLRTATRMKVTVYTAIAASKLRHLVPPTYRDAAAELAGSPVEYSVMLFAHTPRDVVPSAPVRKALRRVGEPAPGGLVAVGTVFTQEALDLLTQAGAHVIAMRRSYWTDESARLRQL